MVAIPFPVTTFPGYRGQEANGRLINAFSEPIGEGTKDAGPPSKRVRVPGMTAFATSAQNGFRGMALLGPTVYAAYEDVLYRFTAAGAMTLHAALSGDLPVYFARNNAPSPDKVVVTENGAFVIVDPNTISAYPDGDLPQPNGVCSIDGYFVFTIGDGRLFASDLNSTAVNALSFGTTDVKPDPPVRPISFSGRLLIFGEQSLEIWTDVGTEPFPFQRATTVPVGLIGPDAVAGWEDGWGAGLLWAANDHTVRILDGYTPVRVSTPDLERLIQRDTNKDRLLASVYVVDGHPMWSITGESFSWSFDLSTRKWHERASHLDDRWRGMQSINAYDKWLIGDRGSYDAFTNDYAGDDGNVYELTATVHTEADNPLTMRIESGPVLQFPQRIRVAEAQFQVEVGVGVIPGTEPIETDPVALISYTDDGISWSTPRFVRLGRQAEYINVSVYRAGMTTRLGRRWRIDISDPVYVAVFGGEMSTELRKG